MVVGGEVLVVEKQNLRVAYQVSHPCSGRDRSRVQGLPASPETWMGSRLRGNDFYLMFLMA